MRLAIALIGIGALAVGVVGRAHGADVGARPKLGFEGIHLETALVDPEQADTGVQYGGSIGLGTVFTPWLHLTAGVARWSTDIDRSSLGNTAKGTISDFVLSTDLRVRAGRIWRVHPYVLAGIAAHVIGADIPEDRSTEDALSDFSPGFDVGIGVRSNMSGLGATLEARRRFVDTVDNWTVQLGLGWMFGNASSTIVVPTAPYPVLQQPVMAAPVVQDPRETESLARIARAMKTLTEENRALKADVDSLRRSMSEAGERVSPSERVQPAGASPAASVRPADDIGARRAALGDALMRIPIGRDNDGALQETPEGYRLSLGGTFAFASSRTELSVAAREALRQIALIMFRLADVDARVEGHADSWGTPEGNMKISVERAMAVRSELVRLGIPEDRITATGKGSSVPLADNTTAEGRARNRRVEIFLEVR